MEELEFELHEAFDKLDNGQLPTESEIYALKYACGFVKPNQQLRNLFEDFGTIFGGNHA